ncbi:hypothetical protein ABFS83_06G160300 [Erythranthe nasuta]
MGIFRRLPLCITLAAVVFTFLPSPPFPSAAAAAAGKLDLATKVCKNTTNPNFCRAVVFSDPRAAEADRVVLAYIVFGQTYVNTTSTQTYIASKIKSIEASGGGESGELKGLRKCRAYYEEANRTLIHDMLQNLDSESYYGFDKASVNVEGQARACRKDLGGASPMTKRNDDLIELAKICYAVSLLFPYGG